MSDKEKTELDELNKNEEETPEVPDGEDPSPIINDKKVGQIEATNTKLYKKYKYMIMLFNIHYYYIFIMPYASHVYMHINI